MTNAAGILQEPPERMSEALITAEAYSRR